MDYDKLTKRAATATLLLHTFSRQRAPEALKKRVVALCTNSDELIAQNEAFATASEIDVLRLTLAQLDVYERLFEAQVELAKHRLNNASYRVLDAANAKATIALLAWSDCYR